MASPLLEVVRVFTAPDGSGGNALGVFLDAGDLSSDRFQPVAADLGYSETVFVTDRSRGALRIFTPAVELPLAGHPLVGTSWLLHREGPPPKVLRPPAGEVPTWQEGAVTWIRADPGAAPEFDFVQLGSAGEVDGLDGAPGGGMTVAWAWSDERDGRVRARAFLRNLGVAEDEATGAAALRLCERVKRPIEVMQGTGSVLYARPANEGVEVGGRVAAVERRPYPL